MPKSEITRFRQEQALQEQAANLGLYGPAITASHEFITARAERGAAHILRLLEEGRRTEAFSLLEHRTWVACFASPCATCEDSGRAAHTGSFHRTC